MDQECKAGQSKIQTRMPALLWWSVASKGLGPQGSALSWARHGPWARTSRFQPHAGGAMPCGRFMSGDVPCVCTGPGLDGGGLRMSRTQSLPSSRLQPGGRRRPRTCKLIKEQSRHQRCRVLRGGERCRRGVGRAKQAGAEGGSREALGGLDWTPWAMASHRRLLNLGVTQAGQSFVVFMEPEKAQRRVTEMIKGLATGHGERRKSEEERSGKTMAGGEEGL